MTLHNRYIMQFLVVCVFQCKYLFELCAQNNLFAESFVLIAKECVNDQYFSYYNQIIFSRIKETIYAIKINN